jgi:protein-tyrosine phosphatase
MDPREFSQPANEILPGLWLGNFNAAKDETFFRTNQIQVVFNCTKDLPFTNNAPIKYRVPVDDNLEEEEIRNLALWSAEIALKIAKHYQNGDRILIHCMAGMQRSAASMAIFLIAYKRWRTDQVIEFIRSKRQIAFFPQANFLKSIQYFEQRFYNEILPKLENKKITINTI